MPSKAKHLLFKKTKVSFLFHNFGWWDALGKVWSRMASYHSRISSYFPLDDDGWEGPQFMAFFSPWRKRLNSYVPENFIFDFSVDWFCLHDKTSRDTLVTVGVISHSTKTNNSKCIHPLYSIRSRSYYITLTASQWIFPMEKGTMRTTARTKSIDGQHGMWYVKQTRQVCNAIHKQSSVAFPFFFLTPFDLETSHTAQLPSFSILITNQSNHKPSKHALTQPIIKNKSQRKEESKSRHSFPCTSKNQC